MFALTCSNVLDYQRIRLWISAEEVEPGRAVGDQKPSYKLASLPSVEPANGQYRSLFRIISNNQYESRLALVLTAGDSIEVVVEKIR